MCPQWHRKSCKDCGGFPWQVGPISGTGKCESCAKVRQDANIAAMIQHRGPEFDRWRRRCLAAFGVTLPDEEMTA